MNGLIVKQNSDLEKILLHYGYKNIDIIFFEKEHKSINIKKDISDCIYLFNQKYLYNKIEKKLFNDKNEAKNLKKRYINLLEFILENQNQKIFTFEQLKNIISNKQITQESLRSAISTLNSFFDEPILINEYGIGYRISPNI